jgi:leader peptidase (prepilin peptidase)/N-methyltransferase
MNEPQSLLLASLESVLGVPEWVGYVFIFILGACIGSFLNVVIYRVPNELSIVLPNSACPNCKTSIRPYDNIPILSWLLLGGKCRNCKKPIAWRYPAVELLTAIVFVLTYWQIGLTPFLPVALIFVATMIALVFIDSEHMILPNVITYPLFVLAVAVRIVFPIVFGGEFSDMSYAPISQLQGYPLWVVSLAAAVLGALVGGGSLWLVGALWKLLRGVDAMGLGDVKMMFAVGALLGWRLTILTIFLGAFSGAIIGVMMIAKQKTKDMQAQIPFGIFLGIGAIISMLVGDQLISWYMASFIIE